MAGNRDVILADFQACTDIEDVGEAILYLEDNNWDLLAAINNVMPRNTQKLPSEMSRDVEMIEEIKHSPVKVSISEVSCVPKNSNSCSDKVEAASTSNFRHLGNNSAGTSRLKEPPRTITFLIHYLSEIYKIQMQETSKIGDLKLAIFDKSKVLPCQQQLYGWRKEPQGDLTILKSLNLPKENELFMSPISEVGDDSSSIITLSDKLARTYTLNIKDEINNTTYNLNFLGSLTILEVKSNIYTLIDVPVRNQLWKGWPPTVRDDKITLAQSGISYPEHDLTVGKVPTKESKKEIVDLADTDSSLDDQDDGDDDYAPETFQVDDDIFIDHVSQPKTQYLMSNNVEDEIIGTLEFAQEFEKRYGPVHPTFFTGTFEEAVAESCLKPPRERKLLAVYLHHDNSILANVFCTQLLGFETVLQLLTANFIVYGWDCTHESNEQKFLASVQQVLGPVAAMAVRNIDVDTMPVLIIIMRSRSNTEVFTIINGNVGVNDLLSNLIEAVDVFQDQRQNDIHVDDERQARERVKEEQDRAYQESLAVDRAKEEAKQLHEKNEKQRKEKAENERLAEEARKEAHRLTVESSLPSEPEQEGEGVLKIKVRLPAGDILERKFLSNTKLQIVLNYLIAKGYPTDEYKVLSAWPRRDLTSIDTKQTLRELNFCAQETLIVQER